LLNADEHHQEGIATKRGRQCGNGGSLALDGKAAKHKDDGDFRARGGKALVPDRVKPGSQGGPGGHGESGGGFCGG
jgi:hypothetical protein